MSEKNITPAILGASFELARNSVTFTPDDLIAQIDRFHGVEVTPEYVLAFVKSEQPWLEMGGDGSIIRRKADGRPIPKAPEYRRDADLYDLYDLYDYR